MTATGFLSGWSRPHGPVRGLHPDRARGHSSTTCQGRANPRPYTCPNAASVRGRAYGVGLLVRRPLAKRLGGWLSCTLSRSMREAHFITPQGGDAVATVPSDFDRPSCAERDPRVRSGTPMARREQVRTVFGHALLAARETFRYLRTTASAIRRSSGWTKCDSRKRLAAGQERVHRRWSSRGRT